MNTQALYLALDQGGHSSRAFVMNSTGEVIAKAQVSISTQTLSDTRIEHSAIELAESLRVCCDQVAEQLGSDCAHIQSAGLATQRSSIVCWQRSTGVALTPVLSWQDRRAAALIEQHEQHSELVEQLTGLVMSPHYGASKLRWCLDNNEAVQEALTNNDLTLGPLASYLLRWLTTSDQDMCDPANASRTLLWNRHTRDWSKKLCNLFGIERTLLPLSVPTRHDFGHVLIGSCRVPLTLLTGDQSAALYAFGATNDQSAFINCGTGAFMQYPIGQNTADIDGLLNSVVYQDEQRIEYVLEGTVNGAGRALTWWAERFEKNSKLIVEEALQRLTSDYTFATGVPLFLNGISGLGSPYWRSNFASRFLSVEPGPDKSATPGVHAGAVAIMESIAFLLAQNVEQAKQHVGSIDQLVLTGGLASVDYLCQALADTTGIATARSTLREATAKGVGYLLSLDEQWPGVSQLTRFEPSSNDRLLVRHTRWQAELSHALSA